MERGGTLLNPPSMEMLEDMMTHPLIAELLQVTNLDYWIGGVSGLWTWENGDIPTYSGWISDGNPRGDVVGRGQCAAREPSGVWKIYPCDAVLGYACEYRKRVCVCVQHQGRFRRT